MKISASPSSVVILDSFSASNRGLMELGVARSKRYTWNQELPKGARGIYIGGIEGQVYDLWVEEDDGSIVLNPNLKPGVTHSIASVRVINDSTHVSTAVNVIIRY